MFVVGIDEVGRGPLAGPLAVGAFCCSKIILRKHFRGVKDSKQLSAAEREAWFGKIIDLQKDRSVNFSVTFVSSGTLDRIGISASLRRAISLCLVKLKIPAAKSLVLLDGGIKAPPEFLNQKTIIKGDEKEPIIALASIAAKVTRDRLMVRLAKKYPDYGFEKHKGYGTKGHYRAIKKFGICEIHRKSFLRKLLSP